MSMHFLKDPESSLFFTCIFTGLVVLMSGVCLYLYQFLKLRRNEFSLYRQTRNSFLVLISLISSFLAGYSLVLLAVAMHFEIDFNSIFGPILFLGALFVLATAYLTNRMFGKLLKSREALKKLAYQDYMTKLANRKAITEQIGIELQQSMEKKGHPFAVVFIDLLNFKKVNDSFGHNIGDKILFQASQRLLETDAENCSAARIGGDDFVLLLKNMSSAECIKTVRTVRHILRQPYSIDGFEFNLDASYGIFFSNEDEITANEAINRANIAMRRSKLRGKNILTSFNIAMCTSAYDTLQFESDFKTAIQEDQFELVFQPQFNIQGEITLSGVEALVRWYHPERGMISPADFIPMAEETGLIVALDRYVLDKACAMWASCLMKTGDCKGLHISVNLSAKHINEPSLPRNVADIIQRYEIPPESLYLELTESAFVGNPALAVERLKSINSLGVHCSIDDFGTGYSSLAYLSTFPTQSLKIDRSFITDIEIKTENRKLVESIINLAHGLGMEAVAEGVETKEQLEILKVLGCDIVQGFYLSRPLPEDETKLLFKNRT